MVKKSLTTPRYKVRSALRMLWLRSRERAMALKEADYRCQVCGVKRSTAKGREVKVECHHREGMEWERLIDLVYERLLCGPEELVALCEDCHTQQHEKKP